MNKFSTLIEGTQVRYTQGGLLPGDLVKVKKEALTSEWAKKQAGNLIEKLKQFIDTDLHVRVSAVKTLRPAVGGGHQTESNVDDYYCDVVIETAPGLYVDFITLPVNLLEYIEQDINLPELPDSLRRDEPSKKIEEYKAKRTNSPTDSTKQTLSDDTNRSLPRSNTDMKYNSKFKDNFNTSAYIKGLN